jgi:hypothetical protein
VNRPFIIVGIADNEFEAIISTEEELISMISEEMAREIDQEIIDLLNVK